LHRNSEPAHCVIVPGAESPEPPDDPAPLRVFEDDEVLGRTKKTTAAIMIMTATIPMIIFGVTTKPAAAGGMGGTGGYMGGGTGGRGEGGIACGGYGTREGDGIGGGGAG
jgi:hypothetical protein